jgi:catechol 2,3-dioxygenase-like lactoylglutathione lyase family enzyme
MTTAESIYDIAHLGHVEMLTPKPEESLRFFVEVMGMTESGRRGDSVYLRAWDDYERLTLKLTASRTSGLGHLLWTYGVGQGRITANQFVELTALWPTCHLEPSSYEGDQLEEYA